MSGLLSITVQEARGAVVVAADLDQLAVVIGCSSGGSGLSPFFLSGTSAIAAVGYGDAVDTLTQIIEQRQASGSVPKRPAALYSTPADTDGSYGTINDDGVTGTSEVTVDSSSHPRGTYDAQILVVNGGTIGAAGITLRWSLDGGRTWSPLTALGTATSFTIPNSGVKFDFDTGDLEDGDLATVLTEAPAPGATEIQDAFAALANASIDFSLVVCEFPVDAALIPHLTTGLNALAARGKECTVLARTRIPDWENEETEVEWGQAIEANLANAKDSRIVMRASYGLVTDAMTSRRYLRSDLAQFAADVVRVPRLTWPCAPADQPMANFALVNDAGADVGHDEGPRGAFTGLSNPTLGNRFSCVQRLPNPRRREQVFNSAPWTLHDSDERFKTIMTRRLANAMKVVARDAGTPGLGDIAFFVKTSPSTGRLTDPARAAIQGRVYQAIREEFRDEINNADDADLDSGLVQIDQDVTVSGDNLLGVTGTINPEVGGHVLSIAFTLAPKE